MNSALRLWGYGCAFAWALGCGEAITETGATQEAIVNGTSVTSQSSNPGVVALYHQSICASGDPCSPLGSYFWFQRPCSATILRTWKNETWILTARHCVTTTGDIEGTVLSTSRIRIHTGLNPGVITTSPPSGSVQPDRVVAPSVPAGTSGDSLLGYDVALVHVPSVMTAPGIKPFINLQPEDDLSGLDSIAYGYGRFVEVGSPSVENGTSGAGRLRYGKPFPILDDCDIGPVQCGFAGWYEYDNDSPLSQSVWRGDSGGPTFVARQASPLILEQVGVHSSALLNDLGWDAQTSGSGDWIQSNIGYLHVSPYSNTGLNLTAGGGVLAEGASVALAATGTSPLGARWVWDRVARRIYALDSAGNRYYLRGSSLSSPTFGAVTVSRTPPSQYATWDLQEGWLSMNNGTSCLQANTNGTVRVTSCSVTASKKWAWHGQP